jgi:Tfp pilus assembly protein PilN
LKRLVATPAEAKAAGPGTVVGVPGRLCRTLGLSLPTKDPSTLRKMAYSQLERRGLARGSIQTTLFDCHSLPDRGSSASGDSRVSVDVLSDLPDDLELANARGYTAAARLFPLPENKLLLWQEQGQLILSAGCGGKLVHSQVIGPVSRLQNGAAQEINLTLIALEGEGFVDETTNGLVVWGDYSEDDLGTLRSGLDMPVELKRRPAPSAALASSESAGELVPNSVTATRHRHRRTWIVLCGVIALIMAYLVVLHRMNSRVEGLEAQIPQLEKQVSQTKDVAERVQQAQARWNTLRPVLEPKRYPLVHLTHIARVMPGGGVRINDFASKIKEVVVKGEARDAASAYEMLRLLQADEELKVYNWSMPQPSVQRDSRATFEIKGNLR